MPRKSDAQRWWRFGPNRREFQVIKSPHRLAAKTTKNWSILVCIQPYASWPIWANQCIHLFLVGCLNPCLQRTSVQVGSPQPSWPLSHKQLTSLQFRNHHGEKMFVDRLGVKPSLMCPFNEMAVFLLNCSLSLHVHTMSCNFFSFYQNSQVV